MSPIRETLNSIVISIPILIGSCSENNDHALFSLTCHLFALGPCPCHDAHSSLPWIRIGQDTLYDTLYEVDVLTLGARVSEATARQTNGTLASLHGHLQVRR